MICLSVCLVRFMLEIPALSGRMRTLIHPGQVSGKHAKSVCHFANGGYKTICGVQSTMSQQKQKQRKIDLEFFRYKKSMIEKYYNIAKGVKNATLQ